jgi:hypothetical protein
MNSRKKSSGHVEALHKRLAGWRAIKICHHDIGHVGPPALAGIRLCNGIPALFALDLRIAKEFIGLGIEMDRVVRYAMGAERRFQVRPDRAVAARVFLGRARLDFKEKSFADIHGSTINPPSFPTANANIRFL